MHTALSPFNLLPIRHCIFLFHPYFFVFYLLLSLDLENASSSFREADLDHGVGRDCQC